MSHNPDHVPTLEQTLEKLYGGSKHGRTDYVLGMLSCAHGKVILDEIERLRRIEAAAKAYIEAQDAVFSSDEVLGKDGHGLPVVRARDEAREQLRRELGA